MHEDALSLPLVAYRGLWDKFAAPGTLGALRRAYLRNVPSLWDARVDEGRLAAALALVANRSVNRFGRPVYLMTTSFPSRDALGALMAARNDVFVILQDPHDVASSVLWRWGGSEFTAAGWYVPVGATLAIRRPVANRRQRPSLVLFESQNVVTDLTIRFRSGNRADDETLAAIRAASGTEITVARVSDMVELDQLDRRVREAS